MASALAHPFLRKPMMQYNTFTTLRSLRIHLLLRAVPMPVTGDPRIFRSQGIHSVGGLAGFVGGLYGLNGVLFDNMTFNSAVL